MKINSIITENFERIVYVQSDLDSNSNLIVGKNGQGKSSLINSIIDMFEPFNITSIPNKVHKGAKSSKRIATLDNGYTLEVEDRPPRPRKLIMRDKTGKQVKITQTLLKELYGKRIIELDKLLTMSDKDWVDWIIKLTPGAADKLSIINQKIADNAIAYTNANSDQRNSEEVLSRPLPEFVEEVDVTELQSEMNRLSKVKNEYEIESYELMDQVNKVERLRKELMMEEERLIQLSTDFSKLDNVEIEYNQVVEKLKNASDINVKAIGYKQALKDRKDMEEAVNRFNAVKEEKAELLKQRKQILNSIIKKCPVDGIDFSDDLKHITINDQPVKREQIAFSELVKLGVSLMLSEIPKTKITLENGDTLTGIKTVFIKAAVAFDGDSIKQVRGICKKEGVQVLIEDVVKDTWRNGIMQPDYETALHHDCRAIIIHDGREWNENE